MSTFPLQNQYILGGMYNGLLSKIPAFKESNSLDAVNPTSTLFGSSWFFLSVNSSSVRERTDWHNDNTSGFTNLDMRLFTRTLISDDKNGIIGLSDKYNFM